MKSIRFLLGYLFVINFLDAFFTWVSVTSGSAYEVNPIVKFLLDKGPFVFFTLKIGIINGAIMYLYYRMKKCTDEKKLKLSKIILFIASLLMTVVITLGVMGFILCFLME